MNQNPDDTTRWHSNFYEIAWTARSQVIKALLAQTNNDLWEAMKRFLAFESQHTLKINTEETVDPKTGKTVLTANRSVQFLSRPSPKRDPSFPLRDLGVLIAGEDAADLPETVPNSMVPPWIISALASEGFDAIVELGCGYGRRLFEIHYECGHRDAKLYGGEYTDSGLQLATELTALDEALDITVFKFDHLQPDLSAIGDCGKALIFTCHSIEQVKTIPEDYFEALAGAADRVTGIHFEPFGFQASKRCPGAANHEAFIRKSHFNQNFYETACRAHENGIIHIHWMALQLLKFQPSNPSSLLIWTKAPPR